MEKEMSLNYEQIAEFRDKLFSEIDENADCYYKDDIQRLKTDDLYCQKFILHQRKSVEKGVNMAKEEIKWRKEFGVKEITEHMLPQELFQRDCVHSCSKDKWGRTVLHIKVKNLRKTEPGEEEVLEKFMVYWVEKIVTENKGAGISVFIDCTGAGLKNANLDIVRFSKQLFTYHYPKTLGFFLVYNMPWILSAIWSLVKSWLPKYVVDMIKFVDKTSIMEFIDEKDLPAELGGKLISSKCTTD
ncbi:motile sperm domain-containing protein 2-like [Centruroides sculpturatus]|uniref:motile sperm domain-containing protein 2-like n=1 Tax=Centruroides sculpturatus TaxID=218467 RepID=UPI000C6DD053|nr:motile sperm domain-containing protein 2-like [Centruroides sculpturatus]